MLTAGLADSPTRAKTCPCFLAPAEDMVPKSESLGAFGGSGTCFPHGRLLPYQAWGLLKHLDFGVFLTEVTRQWSEEQLLDHQTEPHGEQEGVCQFT